MRRFFSSPRHWLPAILLLVLAAPALGQVVRLNTLYSSFPGDANRDPDWDWTQNVPYTLYTTQGAVTVPLPYFSSGGGAGELNDSTGRDIYPADGWVLVVRHFGNPTIGVEIPLFILYNKYRGLLRLYYWPPFAQPVSQGACILRFVDPARTAALMTFSGPDPEYVGSYNAQKSQIAIGKMIPRAWNYFDFDLSGYDPNLAGRVDPTLEFLIAGIVDSSLALEGTLRTDTGSTTVANPNASANLNNLVGFYEKPAQRYKQIEDARRIYEEMAAKEENKDKWWAKFLDTLRGVASKDWLKALGPAIGFVEAVLGFGSGSGGPTPLLINATVKLNGTITTQTQFYSYQLRVPGALHADPANDVLSNILPLYDRPLGIFNVLAQPVLEVSYNDPHFVCQNPWEPLYPGGPPSTQVEICRKEITQRLAQLDYVINPDSGLALDSIDAAYLPAAGGLPDFYVAGVADGYRPLCSLEQTVVRSSFGNCPPSGSLYCPEQHPYMPEVEARDIGLRVRLRVAANPAIEPTLLIRKYRPRIGSPGPSSTCTGSAGSTSSSANPFRYASPLDQYRACTGIAGRVSSTCSSIADLHDRQMCSGMAASTQSPCTSMTDRNLQLACYGMSVAPNYPSNCRDITDAGLRDFCYSVASWGSSASCSGVANAADQALCQALTYRNTSYCGSISNLDDRAFCNGVASRTSSYCNSIPH